jgi:cytochrome b561
MARPSGEYDAVAKLLHWLIATFVLCLIGLGLTMTRTGGLALKLELYQLHKSMGITVLMLMMLRIAWRLFLPPPDLPPAMPGWEQGAARGTHLLLYAMLLALPLSGWAMVSATLPPFNLPTVLYKAIPWPHIPGIENLSAAAKKTVEALSKNVHAALGWALAALVSLHVAAALRHGFILKDGVMLRMWPRFLKLMMPLAVIGFFGTGTLPAAAQEWALNKDRSKLTFEADAAGQILTGEFQQFEAEIRFDPEHPDITEISAAIDVNTISTGQSQADDALRSAEWFDAQTYPAAGLKVSALKPGSAEGRYTLEGTLIIKGKARPISMPITVAIDLGEATVKGEAVINRLDFGIGPSGPVSGKVIGNQVRVRFDISATRLDN